MNYNLFSYLIYLIVTVFITVWVGKAFHKNGIHYILSIFEDEKVAHAINNLLLVGYYLVNIGYAILKISDWTNPSSFAEVVSSVSLNLANILLVLALLNYINIGTLATISYYKSFNHSKN